MSTPPPWFVEAIRKALIEDCYNSLPWWRQLWITLHWKLDWKPPARVKTLDDLLMWMRGSQPLAH